MLRSILILSISTCVFGEGPSASASILVPPSVIPSLLPDSAFGVPTLREAASEFRSLEGRIISGVLGSGRLLDRISNVGADANDRLAGNFLSNILTIADQQSQGGGGGGGGGMSDGLAGSRLAGLAGFRGIRNVISPTGQSGGGGVGGILTEFMT